MRPHTIQEDDEAEVRAGTRYHSSGPGPWSDPFMIIVAGPN